VKATTCTPGSVTRASPTAASPGARGTRSGVVFIARAPHGARVTGSGGRLVGPALDATFENEFKAITRGIGALHPDAVADALAAGAEDVLLVACPAHDCGYREGPRWLEERRARRPLLRRPNVHVVTAAPGSREAVLAAAGNTSHERSQLTAHSGRGVSLLGLARSLAVSLALLGLIFVAALAAQPPAAPARPPPGPSRIPINHPGQLLARSRDLPADVVARLPAGVDPALVLGGERFPVHLQLLVDGRLALERVYQPGGLRREGSIYGLETWWLPPGSYRVEIRLMDDGATWRTAFDGTVTVVSQRAATLIYDPSSNVFMLWQ
jgi:hypothetical protein